MAFGQQHYPALQEGNGYVIALCNLLERFGEFVNPATFNDPIMKNFDWRSLSQFTKSVIISEVSDQAVWPKNSNAIIHFHRSLTNGHKVDTYCAVVNAEDRLIIDSWDGLVHRAGDEYGLPLGFTAYAKRQKVKAMPIIRNSLKPSLPRLPNPSRPLTAPSLEVYAVVTDVKGYLTPGLAATRKNSVSLVTPGRYNIFNRLNGMVNVTRQPGIPGWWIDPQDNVYAKPEPEIQAPVITPTIPVIQDVAGLLPVVIEPEAETEPESYVTLTSGMRTGIYNPVTTISDRKALHTMKFRDRISIFYAKVIDVWDKI